MNRLYEINSIRMLIAHKTNRRIIERIIPCLWCPKTLKCEHKKIKVNGKNWRQVVPLKQYCETQACAKRAINFRTRLAKKLKSKDKNERLTAEYCLWKMITRQTPYMHLSPILNNNFKREKTKTQKGLLQELEILVKK